MSQLATAAPLLEEAKDRCALYLIAEQNVRACVHTYCVETWLFGRALTALKESDIARHGNWQFYIAAQFPALGEKEVTRCRRAQDAMAFFKENPQFDPKTPGSAFLEETIRSRIFRLAPEKERPQLTGNAPVPPASTPLTFVNNLWQWDQKVRAGLVTAPPREELQRQFEPVIKRIAELGGKEWLLGLLAGETEGAA